MYKKQYILTNRIYQAVFPFCFYCYSHISVSFTNITFAAN